MIDGRTLLKSATALAIPSQAIPAPTSAPAVAGPGTDGTIRLRLPVGYDSNDGRRNNYFVVVEIMTPRRLAGPGPARQRRAHRRELARRREMVGDAPRG